jgi:hypothetical protein
MVLSEYDVSSREVEVTQTEYRRYLFSTKHAMPAFTVTSNGMQASLVEYEVRSRIVHVLFYLMAVCLTPIQCYGSGMFFIPDSNFSIPDPGSNRHRIQAFGNTVYRIRDVFSGSGLFSIPDPDPQHCAHSSQAHDAVVRYLKDNRQ